jgi:uncharacterized membrane protein
MCCKVWGVDLTLFFKLFLYFYIIYILSIYFIIIFERSTGQKHSSQQKTKIMNQKVILTNKTTNKVSFRVFRSKKECNSFMNNWANTYTFKVLTTF